MTNKNMFYGANPLTFEKAKMLRLNMTKHEKLLWEELRFNKVLGLRFKSQHPIDTFIADFYCHKVKLVIEVDGENHFTSDQTDYDKSRTATMNEFGISVIRFSNNQVENDLESVMETIKEKCHNFLNQFNSSMK